MALARKEITVTDAAGNVVAGATVTVRRETSGTPLEPLYSDRDGTVAIGNPTSTDANGVAAWHCAGGAFQIEITSGGDTRTMRYVGIGTAAESDGSLAERTITADAGLTGGGTLDVDRSLAVGAGTGIVVNADDVAIDKASNANVWAAASNKVLTADLIESASAFVTLTETSGTVAVDWDSFVTGIVTIDQNSTIANPTNGQPGTWRTILVAGNDATDRTVTFGNQYFGDVPTLTDVSSDTQYLLMIFCLQSTWFAVSSKRVL